MEPLILEHLPPAKWWRPARWRVVEDIQLFNDWVTDYPNALEKTVCITVPADFTTDGASIPRPFWPLFSPTGKHMRAAILHDYLYQELRDNYHPGARKAKRRDADKLFYLAMLDSGIGRWRAKLMYWAVRLFGGLHI